MSVWDYNTSWTVEEKGMKDKASSVIVGVVRQQLDERGRILRGQEYHTRHGVSVIPDKVRGEMWGELSRPEI